MTARNYCEVRLIIATKNDDVISTEKYDFDLPPTLDDYWGIIYADISYTEYTNLKHTDIQYIIAILDWYSLDGQHAPFTMPLDIAEVWPEEFDE